MASQAECAKAVRNVAAMLAAVDPETRAKYVLARSVSLRVSDLDVVWSAQLTEDGLENLTSSQDAEARAQVRLTTSSDDLIALVAGELSVAAAVAVGRLRVQASPMDLLRLTNLI